MAETEQKEEKMKKELEKVYDPKQVEDQDLSVLGGKTLFSCRTEP